MIIKLMHYAALLPILQQVVENGSGCLTNRKRCGTVYGVKRI